MPATSSATMPAIATTTTIDPLKAFAAGASAGSGRPIPLVSTRFDVDIDGGVATVTTRRVFRNDEAESIEATITFPVPVHAVLFDLQARIDGRTVTARAQRRVEARHRYEDAIERGKAAVLHEEVLRGVHMLSVAHLGPGKEIEVVSAWAAVLNFIGEQGQLRIPLTVGDIYGRSGLPDSDDLLTGGPVQNADLFVTCRDGAVAVRSAKLDHGRAAVPLNAPIDFVVTQSRARDLQSVAADGREVVLRVSPHQGGAMALNAAIVVDRSSSMDEGAGHVGRTTKHEAVITGLRAAAQSLGAADVIDLWEFNTRLSHIGASNVGASDVGASHRPSARERGFQRILALVARLSPPEGGTEIGAALSGVIAGSDARDILLITDGKSYALDVHELARKGRRITVLLVGEDSLEANVGHLAALSGGDIFVAAEDDLAGTLAAALGSLQAPSVRPGPIGVPVDRIRVVRGNAVVEAEWRPATGQAADTPRHRSVAAVAASLALPVLEEEQAALLAEAEGLVTHLTSLSLVDEEGENQEGIPAMRKIALPRPVYVAECRTAMRSAPEGSFCMASSPPPRELVQLSERAVCQLAPASPFEELGRALQEAGQLIDWDVSPNRLLTGDFSELNKAVTIEIAFLIGEMTALPQISAAMKQMNLSPAVFILGLLAQTQAAGNRSAARIAKAVLGETFTEEVLQVMELLSIA